MGSARKIVGGVLDAVTGAARHAAWYVRYHVEGMTRDHQAAPAPPTEDEA